MQDESIRRWSASSPGLPCLPPITPCLTVSAGARSTSKVHSTSNLPDPRCHARPSRLQESAIKVKEHNNNQPKSSHSNQQRLPRTLDSRPPARPASPPFLSARAYGNPVTPYCPYYCCPWPLPNRWRVACANITSTRPRPRSARPRSSFFNNRSKTKPTPAVLQTKRVTSCHSADNRVSSASHSKPFF